MTTRLRRATRPRNLILFGALGVTVAFMVVAVYSFAYPLLHTRLVKRDLAAQVMAALPPGSVVEEQGYTGQAGSLAAYVVVRLDAGPAQVLAMPLTPGGSLGWTRPIPACGKAERCWLSQGQDHLLTMKVAPCERSDCRGSTLLTVEITRGGPRS